MYLGATGCPLNFSRTFTPRTSPPASDGGAAVEGYFIEGGTSPSSDDITDNVGGHTTTLGGLTNGTTYYFRVDAQNRTVLAPPRPLRSPRTSPGQCRAVGPCLAHRPG